MSHVEGLVSVVVPVYNGAAFLARAIESALAQTYRPLEVIAVDDGSTDGSLEVLGRYSSRIRTVEQANAGVSIARNKGIECAEGEFIAFLDQDDWWLPEKIERQVKEFAVDDTIGLVHTAVSHFVERSLAAVPTESHDGQERLTGDCYATLLGGNALVNSSVMVKRSVLDRVGLLDTSLRRNACQDYDLWLRIAKSYHFAYIADPLTTFRLHPDQGHRDYVATYTDALAIVLRQPGIDGWLASAPGRARLIKLYDALATAHYDAGNPHLSRRYFAQVFWIDRSPRRLARFGVSLLPYRLSGWLRRNLQDRRQRSFGDSVGSKAKPEIPTKHI